MQVKLGWKAIGAHFQGMDEKKARQKFEQLRNRLSKPRNVDIVVKKADALIKERGLSQVQILRQLKEEFGISGSLKQIRNHITVRMKK